MVECVASLELTGIGFCATSLQALQEKIQQEMSSLEEKAYLLAGRSFCLTSPADTARVKHSSDTGGFSCLKLVLKNFL